MKFLADENFPKKSIEWLRSKKIDVVSIMEEYPGISDNDVIKIAIDQQRTILTLDSDFGELIFKYEILPKAGVVFFRFPEFGPDDLSLALMELINQGKSFNNSMVVISRNSIRIRRY